jgi:hypothetical protein
MPYLDFKHINEVAKVNAEILVPRLVPDGRVEGHEYVALNPTRVDNKLGSFRINLNTGKWADFATPHRGGDLISFTAYVLGLSTFEAAKTLAHILGVVYE